MSSLLKDIYSPNFYLKFTKIVAEVIPTFEAGKFIDLIFDENWEKKELKGRMRHTTTVLKQFLPDNFEESTVIIEQIIATIRKNDFRGAGFEYMIFPDYIEQYGIEDYETSVRHIEFVTQFISCEFAVRPFIIKYGEKMLQQMQVWSLHDNHHVRRLASEGSRPRLPWAIAIPELKKNPTAILQLLENLRNDSSEYVRRSVANSLNDIAKDNPHVVLSIAAKWKGTGKETDAIIKHGSRTLLKQGNLDILAYYGLENSSKIEVLDFKIQTPKVTIGTDLLFSFALQNNDESSKAVRIEFAIHYLRQNGQLSKKVFKISERRIQPKERFEIVKKQSFKIITTRKFYPGLQKLEIIINGVGRETQEFNLI